MEEDSILTLSKLHNSCNLHHTCQKLFFCIHLLSIYNIHALKVFLSVSCSFSTFHFLSLMFVLTLTHLVFCLRFLSPWGNYPGQLDIKKTKLLPWSSFYLVFLPSFLSHLLLFFDLSVHSVHFGILSIFCSFPLFSLIFCYVFWSFSAFCPLWSSFYLLFFPSFLSCLLLCFLIFQCLLSSLLSVSRLSCPAVNVQHTLQ